VLMLGCEISVLTPMFTVVQHNEEEGSHNTCELNKAVMSELRIQTIIILTVFICYRRFR